MSRAFVVVSPAVHARIRTAAADAGISMREWCDRMLTDALDDLDAQLAEARRYEARCAAQAAAQAAFPFALDED